MDNFIAIYSGKSYLPEEQALIGCGVRTLRLEEMPAGKEKFVDLLGKSYTGIFRSKGDLSCEYQDLYDLFASAGVKLVNDPTQVALHSGFADQYQLIRGFTPKAVVFSRHQPISSIMGEIEAEELSFPLFVRSEKESAAKYVGIEGCVIPKLEFDLFARCIENLVNNVSGFQSFIFKEVVEIKKSQSGSRLEYRGIVLDGTIVAFDYDKNTLPDPDSVNLSHRADEIVKRIFDKGFKGAYFMDFAVTESGDVIIVETKDILNGSIHDVDGFAKALSGYLNKY